MKLLEINHRHWEDWDRRMMVTFAQIKCGRRARNYKRGMIWQPLRRTGAQDYVPVHMRFEVKR